MIETFLSRTCSAISPDWLDDLNHALRGMNPSYLRRLLHESTWLPGMQHLFSAFSVPKSSVRYILLGESPYPRVTSANGYAFYDAAVGSLWSDTGLSIQVNRATSFRNMLKMLLHARGDLVHDFSQGAIAALDKTPYWQTASELFHGMMDCGFLLLNASLVYEEGDIKMHAKEWRIFMSSLFASLAHQSEITLLLFGRIAKETVYPSAFSTLICEHPYNISFITNPDVVQFFKPLDLLRRHDITFKH